MASAAREALPPFPAVFRGKSAGNVTPAKAEVAAKWLVETATLPPVPMPAPCTGEWGMFGIAVEALGGAYGWAIVNAAMGHAAMRDLEVIGQITFHQCGGLEVLPEGLRVHGGLSLLGCGRIRKLPRELKVQGTLNICQCDGFRDLDGNASVGQLQIVLCAGISRIGGTIRIRDEVCGLSGTYGDLSILDCPSFNELPDGLHVPNDLAMCGCPVFLTLPKRLKVGGGVLMKDMRGWDRKVPRCANVWGHVRVA
jgi:hypothetical protein